MAIIRNVYLGIRQFARRAVINNPTLDRLIGDPLRKIERRLRPYNYLLQQEDGAEISVHDIRLQYRKADFGVIQIIQLTGDYEPETTQYLLDHLKPGHTFVDLGAHIGYMTLIAARAVGPTGRVHAFEPNQDTFRQLQNNIQLNGFSGYVDAVPKAISDHRQIVQFNIAPESSVSARIAHHEQGQTDGQVVEVEAVSLDEYFASLGWPPIHVIKMDVEGAELPALRGMREVSRRSPHLSLIAEVNYPHMQQLNLSGEVFLQAFQEIGFTHFRILKAGYDRPLTMPDDLSFLMSVASRYTVNILCEK